MGNRRPWLAALVCLFIGCYFFVFTRDARFSYFTPDDCLNLYRAWANPAASLWKAGIVFFRVDWSAYRPIPSAWYRLIYDVAGFNPLPFHIANLLVIAADVWLTYCLVRRLTASRETGALAALLLSYHGRFAPLYFDTAFVFDSICFAFYFGALLFYLRIRDQERQMEWRELLVLAALYVCAIDSKEMALTLPAAMMAYEWLYHRDPLRSRRQWPRWLIGPGRGVLLTSALTALCVISRQAAGGMAASSDFQPQFSWSRFMETSRSFVTELLFMNQTIASGMVLLIWLVLFGVAWWSRLKPLKFAWLFIMLSVIPVAFIPPRGTAQYYIPLFGWVLFAALVIVEGTAYIFRTRRLVRAAIVFLAVGLVWARINAGTSWAVNAGSVAQEGERFRYIISGIRNLVPELQQGARVLFTSDPLDDRWQLTSLMRLDYRDADLKVDQIKFMPEPPSEAQIKGYDRVISYRDCRFYDSQEPPPDAPQPGVLFDEWCRPSVFHRDGRLVTPQNPARHDEVLMSMMAGLGDTLPLINAGQMFPRDPLAQVTSPVDVRVDGRPAEVWIKIGWPGYVNRYRVDFRLPKDLRPGMHAVVASSHGASGPAVSIAMK